MIRCCEVVSSSSIPLPHHPTTVVLPSPPPLLHIASSSSSSSSLTRRRALSLSLSATISFFTLSSSSSSKAASITDFFDLKGSGGVKALELRTGDGEIPMDGDQIMAEGVPGLVLDEEKLLDYIDNSMPLARTTVQFRYQVVSIHYYGRLAAKQGWRFDSTYDHKDDMGAPVPFVFVLGSGKVISGIEAAVRSMKVGGIRRIVIPPSQGYQNTSQEPIPPNFFDRQRLFTTIFNPTRLANGEGATLGTLIFDIELVRVLRNTDHGNE